MRQDDIYAWNVEKVFHLASDCVVMVLTLREALEKGMEILKRSNIETPAVDAGVILCYVLNRDKSYIYAHCDDIMSTDDQISYFDLISKRAGGKPVQYITGRQEFMSLPFILSEGVLIPRPDTEVLVETVIGFVREKGIYRARILDVGTGSGCIAVSIAYYIKDSMVTAVDISEKALEIARQNALNSGVADRVTLVRSNLFKELTSHKKYDIIVSNPPYIRTADIKTLQREVRDFEPLEALDGGADGMDFYRKIVYDSVKYIRPFGMLAFEVGYDQARKVCSIMERYYHDIRIIRDYAGVERVVAGIFKHEL